jgi:hypothetical protein
MTAPIKIRRQEFSPAVFSQVSLDDSFVGGDPATPSWQKRVTVAVLAMIKELNVTKQTPMMLNLKLTKSIKPIDSAEPNDKKEASAPSSGLSESSQADS